MDTPTNNEEGNNKAVPRREYMRKYMKERYNKEIEKSRAYNNSLKIKRKYNLSVEEWEKYGIHLFKVYKIKELIKQLPREFRNEYMTAIQEDMGIE